MPYSKQAKYLHKRQFHPSECETGAFATVPVEKTPYRGKYRKSGVQAVRCRDKDTGKWRTQSLQVPKNKAKGWRNEPQRHRMAAYGIKTSNGPIQLNASGWWGEHPLNSDTGLDALDEYTKAKESDKRRVLERIYSYAKQKTTSENLDAYLAITEYLYYEGKQLPEYPRPKKKLTKDEAMRAASLIRKYMSKTFPLESWGHPMLRRNAMVQMRERYLKIAKPKR